MVVTKTMQPQQQPIASGGDQVLLRKGPWMPEEDEVLLEYVRQYGPRDWSSIRSKGLLPRTGKSCRLRWVNKLKPDLKRSGCKFSPEEEKMVVKMQAKLGNKWAKIASYLPGRTDNDVKNFWSTRQKRLLRALQRPKLAAGGAVPCEGSAASSSDGIFFNKESAVGNDLPAFQVPNGASVATNFDNVFLFGEDEHHPATVFDGAKIEPPEIQILSGVDFPARLEHLVAESRLFPESSFSSFFLPDHHDDEYLHHFHSSGSSSISPPKTAKRRSRVKRDRQQLYLVDAPAASDEENSHRAFNLSGSIGDGSSEFELLLQHCHQILGHDDGFSLLSQHHQPADYHRHHHHHSWERLPGLDETMKVAADFSDVTANTTAARTITTAAISSSSSSNSKAVDSCSPDTVLANALPGEIFDCLEPLCPASSSEWWLNRTSL